MGFERRLAGGYGAPILALLLVVGLFGWLQRFEGFYADKLVLVLAAGGLSLLLWIRTRRSNFLIARFVTSLDHGDLAQTFRSSGRGAGLDELGSAFDDALRRLRSERLASVAEMRFSAALADEAPTPLLAIDEGGMVHLVNKEARRLFRESDGRSARLFARYGEEFAEMLANAPPTTRQVCRIRWNGFFQRAIIAISLVGRHGRPWRIVSVQIIQTELDAAEMATQTDLVRVLTHEIMNSLTPVTSLAASSSRMLDGFDPTDLDAVADLRLAIDSLARRASGISHFVESYRAFSETPSASITRFRALPWAEELSRSFRATPQAVGVSLQLVLSNKTMQIEGDAGLLGQAILNLLKNAGQACGGAETPRVDFGVRENEAGRIELLVSDNGPGVAMGLEKEIFLPFFTTKPDGTGVGLSFARQVALLHGGAIGLMPSTLGGATIQIVL